MERYLAFLRGINISGKNKLAMPELKKELEKLKFSEVSTYLNSGNVLFSSDQEDVISIREQIESMIQKEFGLNVPAHVIRYDDLRDVLEHAPQWWGTQDKEKYHNLIFILTQDSAEAICDMVGEPSKELETVQVYQNVIFWTFDRKSYQKCNWWKKTASAGVAEKLTIRTANTIKRVCDEFTPC